MPRHSAPFSSAPGAPASPPSPIGALLHACAPVPAPPTGRALYTSAGIGSSRSSASSTSIFSGPQGAKTAREKAQGGLLSRIQTNTWPSYGLKVLKTCTH